MKKVVVLFMLLLVASGMMAQEVVSNVGASVLLRSNDKFYCNGEKMSYKDCQAYLALYAEQDIYNQFSSGRRMYNTGWGLLGTGLALDAVALGSAIGFLSYEMDPERPTMGPGAAIFLFTIPIAVGGLAFTITGIPLVCVGKNKMKNSVDAYNVASHMANLQPKLGVQVTCNGIGLVCTF